MALHALSLLIQQRLISDVTTHAGDRRLIVLPPLCPLDVSPADFSRAATLIERSHASSAAWLDRPEGERSQVGILGLHRHRRHSAVPAKR